MRRKMVLFASQMRVSYSSTAKGERIFAQTGTSEELLHLQSDVQTRLRSDWLVKQCAANSR